LLTANAELLATQSERIRGTGGDPTVGVDTIRASFDQIYRCLDSIDEFRSAATHTMSVTVAALSGEIRRAEDHLRRSHDAEENG